MEIKAHFLLWLHEANFAGIARSHRISVWSYSIFRTVYSSVTPHGAGSAAIPSAGSGQALAGLPPAVSRFAAHLTGLRPGAISVCAAGWLEAGATPKAHPEKTLSSNSESGLIGFVFALPGTPPQDSKWLIGFVS